MKSFRLAALASVLAVLAACSAAPTEPAGAMQLPTTGAASLADDWAGSLGSGTRAEDAAPGDSTGGTGRGGNMLGSGN